MKTIDINSDLGESFGAYTMGSDAQVLRHVTSANIACGFHASDPLTMVKAVRMAKEAGYTDLKEAIAQIMGITFESFLENDAESAAQSMSAESSRVYHVPTCGADTIWSVPSA